MDDISLESRLARTLHRTARVAAIVCAVVLLLGRPGLDAQSGNAASHWVGTWATAVVSSEEPPPDLRALRRPPGSQQAPTQTPPRIQSLNDQTLRQVIHTSIGGPRIRAALTNAFGTSALTIGSAQVALRAKAAAIVPNSGRALMFSGRSSVTIPPGGVMISDPLDFPVQPASDVVIDVFVPQDTAGMPLTMHTAAAQTNYLSKPGNYVGAVEFPVAQTTTSWYLLSRVDVLTSTSVSAVVTFGDSITDGVGSTINANQRWPDFLARRLSAAGQSMGVLNLGISGNRLLSDRVGPNALSRFDRDVAAQSGIMYVVVLLGINDIGLAGDAALPIPADLIGAYRQLIARAHARGLRIYGATLTPFEGAAYYTSVGEDKRRQVNTWIRTSREFDGVIDFDAVVHDPMQPMKMLAAYDVGDHLHFADKGYQAMAAALDLSWFAAAQGLRAAR